MRKFFRWRSRPQVDRKGGEKKRIVDRGKTKNPENLTEDFSSRAPPMWRIPEEGKKKSLAGSGLEKICPTKRTRAITQIIGRERG